MNELVVIIVWKWWVLILAFLIAIILGIIILWLSLNKQSDEICCTTKEVNKNE